MNPGGGKFNVPSLKILTCPQYQMHTAIRLYNTTDLTLAKSICSVFKRFLHMTLTKPTKITELRM
jgi:hypothetical protein